MESRSSQSSLTDVSATLLTVSHELGRRFWDLHRDEYPSIPELGLIGREFHAFYASFQILRPKLTDEHFLSAQCRRMIGHITSDMLTLCNDIEEELILCETREMVVQDVKKTFGFRLFRKAAPRSHPTDRNSRMMRFLREDNMVLRRNQMRYGELLLKLLAVVVVYAQQTDPVEGVSDVNDYHNFLVTDVCDGLTSIRRKEAASRAGRGGRPPTIEASRWWAGLPPFDPRRDPPSPLEYLAMLWVNREARIRQDRTPDRTEFLEMMQVMRAEHQEEMRKLRAEFRDDRERFRLEHETMLREHAAQLARLNQDRARERAGYEADRNRWTQERAQLNKDKKDLQDELVALRNRVKRLNQEMAAERKAREAEQKKNRELQDKLHDSRVKQTEAVSEAREAQRTRDKAKKRTRVLEEMNNRLEKEKEGMRKTQVNMEEKLKMLNAQAARAQHPAERRSLGPASVASQSSRKAPSQAKGAMNERRRSGPPVSMNNPRAFRSASVSSGDATLVEPEDEEITIVASKSVVSDLSESTRRSHHVRRSRRV